MDEVEQSAKLSISQHPGFITLDKTDCIGDVSCALNLAPVLQSDLKDAVDNVKQYTFNVIYTSPVNGVEFI